MFDGVSTMASGTGVLEDRTSETVERRRRVEIGAMIVEGMGSLVWERIGTARFAVREVLLRNLYQSKRQTNNARGLGTMPEVRYQVERVLESRYVDERDNLRRFLSQMFAKCRLYRAHAKHKLCTKHIFCVLGRTSSSSTT